MQQSLDTHSEHLLRELAPQVLGAIIRRYRDFASAEDAVQEALLAASLQWPRDGVPENPKGWMIQVASRRIPTASNNVESLTPVHSLVLVNP